MSIKSIKEKKSSFFSSLTAGIASIIGGKKKTPEKKKFDTVISEEEKPEEKPEEEPEENHETKEAEARAEDTQAEVPVNPRATRMMVKDNFDELIRTLTTEAIPYVRKYAALKLGELGDRRAIEHLVVAMTDENVEVRMAAAQSLGKLGDEGLVERLISTLEDSNEYLRDQTVHTLVHMGEIAVPSLLVALKSDKWMVSYSAVKALGRIGTEEAITGLASILEDDGNVYVQKAAVEALESLREQAEPEVIRLLGHEFFYVKEKAARILSRIGTADSIEKLREAVRSEEDPKYMERLNQYLEKLEERHRVVLKESEE